MHKQRLAWLVVFLWIMATILVSAGPADAGFPPIGTGAHIESLRLSIEN